jgi:glycosyltransferase involved in cell wall biosynthesis
MIYILIRSRTTFEWVSQSIKSALSQKYDAYKIIFIDDASDYTRAQKSAISQLLKKHIVCFNQNREYALKNAHTVIHTYTQDKDIVIILDGDDYFSHPHVLSRMSQSYKNHDIQCAYGECRILYPHKTLKSILPSRWLFKDHNTRYPEHIEEANAFRKDPVFRPLHPRSFYASLFKKIKQTDFYNQKGHWYQTCEDQAMFYPMLEMIGPHYFVDNVIHYVYRFAHHTSDITLRRKQMITDEAHIRKQTPYERIYG